MSVLGTSIDRIPFLLRLAPGLAKSVSMKRQLERLLEKSDSTRTSISLSEVEEGRDLVTVLIEKIDPEDENVALWVQSIDDDQVTGIRSGAHLQEHPEISVALANLENDQFEVHHYYREWTVRVNDLQEAYVQVRTKATARRYRRQRAKEGDLLKNPAFRDRMKVLDAIRQLTYAGLGRSDKAILLQPDGIPHFVPDISPDDILERLLDPTEAQADLSSWPIFSQLKYGLEMALYSLQESGAIAFGKADGRMPNTSKVFLTPKGIEILAGFEKDADASRTAARNHRDMVKLRHAALLLAFVGLIPTVFAPSISWIIDQWPGICQWLPGC